MRNSIHKLIARNKDERKVNITKKSKRRRHTVEILASLGWVTPGAATVGVTPYFFLKNLATFFSRQFCGVTPDFFFAKTDDLFFAYRSIAFYYFHLGVTPLEGVTPHLFLPVRPLFSSILCKFAHTFFFFRVSPPWRVSPPLVTPL